jgi:hypothetical protein
MVCVDFHWAKAKNVIESNKKNKVKEIATNSVRNYTV